ncbi:MAG TPA: bleomycin resistance family protein [Fulvivirga sp.]|nr:bleomycin resistance family protein [Fulvivirga sp.]
MKLETLTPNLMVDDINQTINYYHGVLSFTTLDKMANDKGELIWARLKKGDVEIMFQQEDSLKAELPEIRKESIGGGFTLYITMAGVDEFYEYLYTTADVVAQLKNKLYGMREFTIRDINGYYLTFAEPIKK